MTYIDLSTDSEIAKDGCALICALGNFDGVHLGHRTLLEEATRQKSRFPHAKTAVFTFLKPPFPVEQLTVLKTKLQLFKEAGIERAVLCDFETVRNMTPDVFVKDILIEKLACLSVVCGFNYRFGCQASGTAENLRTMLAGRAETTIMEPCLTEEGRLVCSTAIRQCIKEGDVYRAARMLGRYYSLTGQIIHGNGLGHSLGFPTINQALDPEIIYPKRGVYYTGCAIDGTIYPAVTNIGCRPTVTTGDQLVCETHILCPLGNLYGKQAVTYFYERRRDEIRFKDAAELSETVEQDIAAALLYTPKCLFD